LQIKPGVCSDLLNTTKATAAEANIGYFGTIHISNAIRTPKKFDTQYLIPLFFVAYEKTKINL
jgi:hypothetical protein